VVVGPEGTVRRRSGFSTPTNTRNVGAELNGLILGLESVPWGAKVCVVSDYLGCAAWLTHNWKIRDGEVAEKVDRAARTIIERELDIRYCHHCGHQQDDSDLTRWNIEADRLAGLGAETDSPG
jgi:hypothetical protein